ncbi:unnamed protein product [Effrenium voratum]|uniref:BTB domain-containing protein n=2 Tax=Effrenium voratum TaxID=2562239 RepID=A0AA36IDS0_9DINO|nr:unnamed protein product [Effrenium voratum]
MTLASALAVMCPTGPTPDLGDETVPLITSDGHTLRCHGAVLRARCPKLEAAEVGEELQVVLPLLQWVYAARVQDRLMARRSKGARGSTLAEDFARAYGDQTLQGRFRFRCPAFDKSGDEEEPELLEGGLTALLQLRSEYFNAMFSGPWAESRHAGSTAVTVYWPREQMARLLEFLHGGSFVAKVEDLRVAMDCASFFGVPSLLHHVREWVAANLKVATAPALWKFVESEPHLKDTEYCEDAEDVEAACFEFHLEHFAELAGVKAWESFGDETNDAAEEEPPLHNLSVDLFHRLLMSGLVRLPTRQLICVVERFARAKCSDPSSTEAFGQLFTSLMPPAVIFNRDCRTALLQSNENVEVRSLIAV